MTFFFEDFVVGEVSSYGQQPVSADDIVAFRSIFDAQDLTTDSEAAETTDGGGGLIGSGWHISAIMMRMMCEGFLLDSVGMGAPGLEELKWMRPVRPGDVLSIRQTVLEVKESRSRPDIGLVRFRFEVMNQKAEHVQEVTNWIIFGRRAQVTAAGVRAPSAPWRYVPPASIGALELPRSKIEPVKHFEQIVIGERTELGSFTFTADDIIAFARAFDPQRFHIDEEAAKASLFGGLCASGWHTCAVWLRLTVAHRQHLQGMMGEAMPRFGSSAGFKNLKWLKPVFAGDTITYASMIIDKRASGPLTDRGLLFQQHVGVNQLGEPVLTFDSSIFWQDQPLFEDKANQPVAETIL